MEGESPGLGLCLPSFSCEFIMWEGEAMRTLIAIALITAVAAVAAGTVQAATIRLDFDGTVITLDDPDGVLSSLLPGFSFNVGDSVTGFYEVDDAASPASSGPVPEAGTFYHLNQIGSIEAIVGANPALVGTDTIATVQIANSIVFPGVSDPFDYWQYRQNLVDPQGGADFLVMTYTLFDFTDTRLSSEDFFLNDSFAGWQVAQMGISQITGTGVFVREVLAADMVVPEPSTALLVGAGLIGIAASRRGASRSERAGPSA